MRTISTFAITLLCCFALHAQHPKFLGISMDEPSYVIEGELINRNFMYRGLDGHGNFFETKHVGTFATIKGCEVNIMKSGYTNKPISIAVVFPSSSDTLATKHFYETILQAMTDKYGEPQITYDEEKELLFNESNKVAKFADGAIKLVIRGFKGTYYPYLSYSDELNFQEHKELERKIGDRNKSTLDDF